MITDTLSSLNDNDYLTSNEAARALGVSTSFLATQRIRPLPEGASLVPFVRIGARTIRYRAGDLKAYLKACTTS